MVFDANEQSFPALVLERSNELPVVVDFWASWCGPCRSLTPALESAAAAREGQVELAKVDVDGNQRLAQTYGVQGIPAVKAFRAGAVVDEFTGAIAPAAVERFFDGLIPSQAELNAARALETGDEQALRRALESDPRNSALAVSLARILIAREEYDEVISLLESFEHDFLAAGLLARSRLSLAGTDLGPAFAAWDDSRHAEALELFQIAFAQATEAETRDLVRRAMIGIFSELGPSDPLAREHRRRLSASLN